jgi:AraC family transcriptional regulator, positive regulator of tynA and feaB
MHTLFSYRGSDAEEMRRSYDKIVRQEFYDGEIEMDPANTFDITIQKAIAHPITLTRFVMRSGVSVRRSWSHIRGNQVGLRVLWFIRQGTLRLVRSRSVSVAEAGQCALLDSSAPFHARATVGPEGVFDSVQAIIPAHLFLTHLPLAAKFYSTFEIGAGEIEVITKLLDLMFGEGDHLSRNAIEPLVAAFLELVSDSIREVAEGTAHRRTVVDKRLADIEAYIQRNLTNPDLSYDEVAAGCGISPRYLCYVLKANSTSFSHLVWSQRLPMAREWLISEAMHDYPIHEIAFSAGFKSAAHFSRMFKATYGCSPKALRALHAASRTSPVERDQAA